MADKSGHAALGRFSKLHDAVELGAALGELLLIAGAPETGVSGAEGAADAAFHIELGSALSGEFVDGTLEVFREHIEFLEERVGGLELVGEEAGDAGKVFDRRVVAFEEALVNFAIGKAMEEDDAGRKAVAAGASDLLVIAFEGGGQGGVDDGADVGLVDAHAKGDGGDDHFDGALEEGALHLVADGAVEASVVGGTGEALVQLGGEGIRLLTGGSVDDGGSGFRVVKIAGDEGGALRFGELDDFDGEVVAAESMNEEGGLVEAELGDDVLLNSGRGSGGEGDDRGGAEEGQGVAESAVIGAEIVTPARDAVSLVHGDEGGLAAGEHLGEAGDAEALGGDEEELELAIEVVAADLAGVVAGEAGVDAGDAQTVGGELRGLVVHEGDEGADDEGGVEGALAGAGHGGKLVAQTFAGAGRHDEEHVLTPGEGAADGFLILTEGGVAEGGMENWEEIHAGSSMFPRRTVRFVVSVQHREHRGHRGSKVNCDPMTVGER